METETKTSGHRVNRALLAVTVPVAVAVVTVFGFVGVAGASTYNASTDIDSLGNTTASTASPILVQLVTDLIPLMIVIAAVALVMSFFLKRRSKIG